MDIINCKQCKSLLYISALRGMGTVALCPLCKEEFCDVNKGGCSTCRCNQKTRMKWLYPWFDYDEEQMRRKAQEEYWKKEDIRIARERRCMACGTVKDVTEYSKTQKQKGWRRRCIGCVDVMVSKQRKL